MRLIDIRLDQRNASNPWVAAQHVEDRHATAARADLHKVCHLSAPTDQWRHLRLSALCGLANAKPQAAPLAARFGFRQRPFPRFVPNLVARQPAPGRLHGENTGEPRWIPAARHARAALAPQAQGLTLQQMWTVLQRRDDA